MQNPKPIVALFLFLILALANSGTAASTVLNFQGAADSLDMVTLMGIIGQWKAGSIETSDLVYFIGLWETAEVAQACADQSGFECQTTEHCTGNSLTALDSARCCDLLCQPNPTCDITNAYWEIT